MRILPGRVLAAESAFFPIQEDGILWVIIAATILFLHESFAIFLGQRAGVARRLSPFERQITLSPHPVCAVRRAKVFLPLRRRSLRFSVRPVLLNPRVALRC